MKPATLAHHRARMTRTSRHLAEASEAARDTHCLLKVAGLSSRQLTRVFTRTFGESPSAQRRRLRLERAAHELRSSQASVLTIAVAAGFESHAAFTRAFRARFGHTPVDYRRLDLLNPKPRARARIWQIALAGGLRRHLEQ